MPNEYGNLYIPYSTTDTGSRPLPTGINFWSATGAILDAANGATSESSWDPGQAQNNVPGSDTNYQCAIKVQVNW